MADINTTAAVRDRHLTRRTIKKSTKPDLTPMVDLGFLLITFFIFSTVLSAPKSIRLRVPAEGPPTPAHIDRLLTIIADSGGVCYTYEARNPAGSMKAHRVFEPESVRQTIIAKKRLLQQAYPAGNYAMVGLKFLPGARYEAFTALFDEVKINGIGFYHIAAVQDAEIKLIEQYKNGR